MCIARMNGLLRRVRYLELRVAVLQFYTGIGRLIITFIPGSVNGADALTKPGDRTRQMILCDESGLCRPQISERFETLMDVLVNSLGNMSSQNRRRVRDGISKLTQTLLNSAMIVDLHVSVARALAEFQPEPQSKPQLSESEESVSESQTESDSEQRKKRVTFRETVKPPKLFHILAQRFFVFVIHQLCLI